MKDLRVILPETLYKMLPEFCIAYGLGALITFANSGIGLALALILSTYGVVVLLRRHWKQ